MKTSSPQIPRYPNPTDKVSVAAQFGLTNTSQHGHTGAAMDGGRIDYSNLTNKPSAVYGGAIVSNAAGTPFPTGWTVTHTGTGAYDITHNLGTGSYVAVANGISGLVICYVTGRSTTTLSIGVQTNTGIATDNDFDFILIVG